MKFKFLTPLLAVATAVPTFQDDPKHDPNVTPACISAGYATFYDDHNCKDNPGRPVSLKNSGCLANEIGRNSIYVQRPCELMRYFNGLSLVVGILEVIKALRLSGSFVKAALGITARPLTFLQT
ncbi:hypothetical protein PENSTE_c007G08273 [Penicillium steckii]|uniref:Uncharacterized protein n=1 Tax=Penicillium steckii TaxID=303698 RepID=A0A1V6TDF8_9EURO|nr:hypothetical protein PENSTE_c007G08273 [Penicillium steckii]